MIGGFLLFCLFVIVFFSVCVCDDYGFLKDDQYIEFNFLLLHVFDVRSIRRKNKRNEAYFIVVGFCNAFFLCRRSAYL